MAKEPPSEQRTYSVILVPLVCQRPMELCRQCSSPLAVLHLSKVNCSLMYWRGQELFAVNGKFIHNCRIRIVISVRPLQICGVQSVSQQPSQTLTRSHTSCDLPDLSHKQHHSDSTKTCCQLLKSSSNGRRRSFNPDNNGLWSLVHVKKLLQFHNGDEQRT